MEITAKFLGESASWRLEGRWNRALRVVKAEGVVSALENYDAVWMRPSCPSQPGIKPSSASWIMTNYFRSYQVWDFYISALLVIEMNIWTLLALGAMVQCQTTSTSSSSSSSSSTSSSSSSSTSSGASTAAPAQSASQTVFLNTSRGKYKTILAKSKLLISRDCSKSDDHDTKHK